MSNLLDQASIVLTPTAYDNGKVLCAKPTDGSGDFDFSRNSAATRVNAQGLVEDVQILSSNLVQNGDFSQTGSEEVTNGSFANGNADWTIENTWTIGEGVANGNGANGSTAELKQTSVNTIGKSYKATFKVLNYVSGSVGFFRGSGIGVTPRTADGVYTEYFTATSSEIRFRGSNFNGSITNISVKEVGQNWFKDANWSIGDNVATSTGAGRMFQSISALEGNIGTKVKVSFNITEVTSGGVKVDCYGATSAVITEVGTHTFTGTTTNSLNLYINNSGTGNLVGSITNISVIEITDDTNLPRINYEGFSFQDALGSELVLNGDFATNSDWNLGGSDTPIIENGFLKFGISDGTYSRARQNNASIIGNCKVTYTVVNSSASTLAIREYAGGNNESVPATIGTHTIYKNFIANGISFQAGGVDGGILEIDNISVREVLGQEVVPDSGCGNWLWEPQSTNIITYSEDFTNSSWTKFNSIITNDNTKILGINALKIVPDNNLKGILKRPATTPQDGLVYNRSVYIKFGGERYVVLSAQDALSSSRSVIFDFTNKDFSYQGGSVSNLLAADMGNEIFRISFNSISSGSVIDDYSIGFSSDGTSTSSFLGNGVDGVYATATQVEQQSYATSYIPTDGTSVTRNQDLCTNGGSAASINITEGVLYAEIAALANDGTVRYLGLSDGSTNNRVIILYYSATNKVRAIVSSGGTKYVDVNYELTNILDFHKVAIKYKLNDFAFWIDGVEVATDTSLNAPIVLDDLSFSIGGSSPFFGKTKAVAVWKETLTDTELAELTTI